MSKKEIYIDFLVGDYHSIGDVSMIKILGAPVFKSVGNLSLLFGVDWSQENANYTS